MNSPILGIDLFTQVKSDFEARQYRVLAGLKKYRSNFQKNRVYPYLSNLIELYQVLKDIMDRLESLREEFPKKITHIDLANKTIEHEVIFIDGSDLEKVEELIKWALPQMTRVIHDGTSVHKYVDEKISVEHVGIVPAYREEGYFFIPDRGSGTLKLYQFEVSIFQSANDRYRALKTRYLKSVNMGPVILSPNTIKLDLIREQKMMPNPATYHFETSLEFPFRETIFPVAKRKLMQVLIN